MKLAVSSTVVVLYCAMSLPWRYQQATIVPVLVSYLLCLLDTHFNVPLDLARNCLACVFAFSPSIGAEQFAACFLGVKRRTCLVER